MTTVTVHPGQDGPHPSDAPAQTMLPAGQAPADWGQPTPVPGWQPQQAPQAAPQGQAPQAAPQPAPQAYQPPQGPPGPQNGPMAQGQLALLPSQLVFNKTLSSTRFVDKRGRLLGIIKPGPAFRMRMMRMAGAELVQNPPYFGLFMLACCVREFDGEPIPEPTAPLQVEALVQRLDQEGLDAIGEAMTRVWGIGMTADEEKAAQDQVNSAKNS